MSEFLLLWESRFSNVTSKDKNLGITLSLIEERRIKDKGLNWASWMESHWKGPVIH